MPSARAIRYMEDPVSCWIISSTITILIMIKRAQSSINGKMFSIGCCPIKTSTASGSVLSVSLVDGRCTGISTLFKLSALILTTADPHHSTSLSTCITEMVYLPGRMFLMVSGANCFSGIPFTNSEQAAGLDTTSRFAFPGG